MGIGQFKAPIARNSPLLGRWATPKWPIPAARSRFTTRSELPLSEGQEQTCRKQSWKSGFNLNLRIQVQSHAADGVKYPC